MVSGKMYNNILNEVLKVYDFDSWDKDSDQIFKTNIKTKISGYPIVLNFDNPEQSVISAELFKNLFKSINDNKDLYDMYTEEVLRNHDYYTKGKFGSIIDWTYIRLDEIIPLLEFSKVYYISSEPLYWWNFKEKAAKIPEISKKVDMEEMGGWFNKGPWNFAGTAKNGDNSVPESERGVILPAFEGPVFNMKFPYLMATIYNLIRISLIFVFPQDIGDQRTDMSSLFNRWTDIMCSIAMGKDYVKWWDYIEATYGSFNDYFEDNIYNQCGIIDDYDLLMSTISFVKRYKNIIGKGI